MCTSAHYLNNIPLVVFTDTLAAIKHRAQIEQSDNEEF